MANSVPELTQISTVLSNLVQNYDELSRNWYDIFYNPVPMDVEVQFFDKDGILFTTTLPNRAKDFNLVLNGEGAPEGTVSASTGAIYQDTLNGTIYIKNTTTGSTVSEDGWVELITVNKIYHIGEGSPIDKQIEGKKGDLYVDISINDDGSNKAELYINTNGLISGWVKVSGAGGGGSEDVNVVHKQGAEEISGQKTFLQDVIVRQQKQTMTQYESIDNNLTLQVGVSENADRGIYDVGMDQWLIKLDSSGSSLTTDCDRPALTENGKGIVTTSWIRDAQGNTNLNAATSTNASNDGVGNNIVNTYVHKTNVNETIEGIKTFSNTPVVLGTSININNSTEASIKKQGVTFIKQDNANNTMLSANNSTIYFRPKGDTNSSNQATLNNLGVLTAVQFSGPLNGTATHATNDGDGNNIVETYATKAELEVAKPIIEYY